ncbi:MAG: tyrosine/phenylalanine carboxypeptidase domain-containing protein [Pontixanthobacter sp.]
MELSDDARHTDSELAAIDGEIDWLTLLTPTNLDAVRQGFVDRGYSDMPELEYPDLPDDFDRLRDRLFNLKVHGLGNSEVEALLIEKQRELDRQIELVRLRGRNGFVMAAIDLFGNVDAQLVAVAERILDKVPVNDQPAPHDTDAAQFMAAARDEMQHYREQDDRFNFEVVENPTPGTHIYTSAGDLHVAFDYDLPAARIDPLIQHEIGVHSVTRFNGRCQPLAVLECGLADYDALQEGVAVLAEYLAGNMPPSRLRLLAARVIAARMAIDRAGSGEIYAAMRDHSLREEAAFDTTMRALRGGGITKDALYLDGLIDLLAYLKSGGDIPFLFIGKFALKQRTTLERLLDDGLLQPAAIIPRCFAGEDTHRTIRTIADTEIERFYKESEPA